MELLISLLPALIQGGAALLGGGSSSSSSSGGTNTAQATQETNPLGLLLGLLSGGLGGGLGAAFQGQKDSQLARQNAEVDQQTRAGIESDNQQVLDLILPAVAAITDTDTNGLEAQVRQNYAQSQRVQGLRLGAGGVGRGDFANAQNNGLFNNFLLSQASVTNADKLQRQQTGLQALLNATAQTTPVPGAQDPNNFNYTSGDFMRNLILGGLGSANTIFQSDVVGNSNAIGDLFR